MAKFINLSTPESGVADGMELSFRAPCNCSDATGVTLDGQNYDLVDASGNSLTSCSGYFVKDAILSVIIDTTNKKATLLNPRVNTYTKSLGTPEDTASATGPTVWARVKQIETDVTGKSENGHKHKKEDIEDFTHNHDDRYYTEDEIDTKLGGKSDTTHSHDDKYYTETEIDDKLSGKSNNVHTHKTTDITDFPKSMPASDVPAWAKNATKPTYAASEVGAYSKSEIDVKLKNLGSGLSTVKDGDGNVLKTVILKKTDGVLEIITSTE